MQVRKSIIERIQRLVYELEHVYFLQDAQRKMLIKEIEKLQTQLKNIDEVLNDSSSKKNN